MLLPSLLLVTTLAALAGEPDAPAGPDAPVAEPDVVEPTADAESAADAEEAQPRHPEPPPAVDLEVAHTRRFGVGVALGWPPSATVKVFVDTKNAVAVHLGTTLGTTGLHLRLQFEQGARRLKTWEWGELVVGWQVGVAVDFLFGQQASNTAVRPGLLAGGNVELRLVPVPVAVFGEASPVLYPFDIAPKEKSAFFPLGAVIVVGARWYF